MDRESVERLRFDRRLQNRREWIDPADLDAHIESLPDVSDKMTTPAELEAEDEATEKSPKAGAAKTSSESATAPSFGSSTSVGGGGFGGDGGSFDR